MDNPARLTTQRSGFDSQANSFFPPHSVFSFFFARSAARVLLPRLPAGARPPPPTFVARVLLRPGAGARVALADQGCPRDGDAGDGGRSCTSPPPPSPRDPAGRKGSTPRSLSSSSSDPQGDGPTAWSKRRVPRGRIWGRKGARQQPASGSRRRRRESQGAGTVQRPGGWEARAGDDGRAASMRW